LSTIRSLSLSLKPDMSSRKPPIAVRTVPIIPPVGVIPEISLKRVLFLRADVAALSLADDSVYV